MKIHDAIKKIKQYFRLHQRLPSSYEEYKQAFGFSSRSSSFELVNKMIAAGIVQKDERGKLIPKKIFSIPHFGVIKAGDPIDAEIIPEETFDIYDLLLSLPNEIFSVTIKGDSMKDALIGDGDVAIIDPNKLPKAGDIVAALIEGTCTLKYLGKNSQGYVLQPANQSYKEIPITSTSIIQGVVLHIIRKIKP